MTVSHEPPLQFSTLAPIAVVPAASAVAIPVGETVATVEFELLQLPERPSTGVPSPSRTVAAKAVVAPTPSVSLAGVTMTDSPPTPPVTFVVHPRLRRSSRCRLQLWPLRSRSRRPGPRPRRDGRSTR